VPKTRKGGALGPRLPVAMSSRTPVRDDWSAPRDLSASWSRATPMVSHKQRRDLTTALILRRVATTWLSPWPGLSRQRWDAWRKGPCRFRLTVLRRPRQTVALCVYSSRRLEPPLARDDIGPALPYEPSACFPGSSDFSVGPFHNRPTHTLEDTSMNADRRGRVEIIPAIHRARKIAFGLGT